MKITSINRQTIRQLRQSLQQAMEGVAKDGDISINVGNASFTLHNVIFKVECALKSDNGEVQSIGNVNFRKYASTFGLPDDALGREFSSAGSLYRITGLNPRSYRYPVQAERVTDGKRFKFPVDAVKFLLLQD